MAGSHLMVDMVSDVALAPEKPSGKASMLQDSTETVKAVGMVIFRLPAGPPFSQPPVRSDLPGPACTVHTAHQPHAPFKTKSLSAREVMFAGLALLGLVNCHV